MNNRPPLDPGSAERQARLRAKRKAEGFKRVSVWLSPEQIANLEKLGGEPWLGRTVKAFLQRAVSEPGRPGKQAALACRRCRGDGMDVGAAIRRKVSEKVSGVVSGADPQKTAEIIDQVAERGAAVRRKVTEKVTGIVTGCDPKKTAEIIDQVAERGGGPLGAAEALRDNSAAALWAEADGLHTEGLSWGDIARRWNDEGRRTVKGAQFRAFNLRRDVERWKNKPALATGE